MTEVPLVRMSIAEPIRNMLRELGLGDGDFGGGKNEVIPAYNRTPRQLMQTLGYEWGRKLVHPDVWLRNFRHRAALHAWVVVDDVRFRNEADWVRSNGVLIHLRWGSLIPAGTFDHPSEDGVPFQQGDIEVFRRDLQEEPLGALADLLYEVRRAVS